VVHDDLVHAPLVGDCAIVASDTRQKLVSVAANGLQPKGNRESHVALLQGAHIGNKVHAHDFRREGAVGRHDLHFAARLGDDFGRLQSSVITSVVEDENIRTGLGLS